MESQNPAQPPAPTPDSVPASTPVPPSTSNPQSPTPPAPSSPPPSTPPQSPPALPVPGNKKKLMLSLIAFLIVIVGFVLLAFWYYQSSTKKPSVQAANPEPSIAVVPQKIVVGTDPTYQPMEYLDNNKLTGYDIDLANFIGKELGAQVEFKQIVFDDLFPALEKKDINMIISTVTVTDERKQKYDFSEPYLQAGQVILTKKDNTTIASVTDLQGKKIAVQKGTTIETEALKYTKDQLVIRYPDFVQATAALVKGDVDAIFTDLPAAKGIISDNPTLKIAGDPFTQEYYAVVFRKGDSSVKEINNALASLKVKGILADLKQEWIDP